MRDWNRRLDPAGRPAQDIDRFYKRAMADVPKVNSDQFFGQMLNERDWEQARRPYYNLWPSIIPMLTRLNLDLDSNLIRLLNQKEKLEQAAGRGDCSRGCYNPLPRPTFRSVPGEGTGDKGEEPNEGNGWPAETSQSLRWYNACCWNHVKSRNRERKEAMSIAIFKGVIRGKTIDLERDRLPDGQRVNVQVEPEAHAPVAGTFHGRSCDRLGEAPCQGDPAAHEDLVELVEHGRSDQELRLQHPELAVEDVDAVRRYAKVPEGLRKSFGGWAEDAAELDEFLDGLRRDRRQDRPEPRR